MRGRVIPVSIDPSTLNAILTFMGGSAGTLILKWVLDQWTAARAERKGRMTQEQQLRTENALLREAVWIARRRLIDLGQDPDEPPRVQVPTAEK